jgi:cyclic lactone autoinducer peptide
MLKLQGSVLGVVALTAIVGHFGKGCGFFLHQPKLPAKLREPE